MQCHCVFAAICGDVTTYAGSTLEIKSGNFMAKSAFNKKAFDQQIGLKLKGEN